MDNVLRAIEFLISVKPGVFSCVFYDATPQNKRYNILDVILRSSRLNYINKYVITNANRRAQIKNLPWNPSLLLIYAGNNHTHLGTTEVIEDIMSVTYSFDPSTKVLVLLGQLKSPVLKEMKSLIVYVQFIYSTFIDSSARIVYQCNAVHCFRRPKEQHPMYLFTWKRRWLKGRKITYIETYQYRFDWHMQWLEETARYLNTKVVEFPYNCSASKQANLLCKMKHEQTSDGADILLHNMLFDRDIPMGFKYLFTSLMISSRFVVPRDRPLNTAELLFMPFSWQVWITIVMIFAAAEMLKLLFPNTFENNPFLLVVCGFERLDLHQAGRWEKILLLPLIILMFFMSNAFETKIISLMVSKPSIQRIKTMDDLRQSGLKIFVDLEESPHHVNDTVVGSMVVQGNSLEPHEAVSDAAIRLNTDWVDAMVDIAYDYKRMQPYYVALDQEFYDGPELFQTSLRNQLIPHLRFMHITLVESGILDLWKQQWKNRLRSMYIGRRPRRDINDKVELNFDDMKPAWLSLGIGLSVGFVGFLLELVMNQFDVTQ